MTDWSNLPLSYNLPPIFPEIRFPNRCNHDHVRVTCVTRNSVSRPMLNFDKRILDSAMFRSDTILVGNFSDRKFRWPWPRLLLFSYRRDAFPVGRSERRGGGVEGEGRGEQRGGETRSCIAETRRDRFKHPPVPRAASFIYRIAKWRKIRKINVGY